MGPSVEYCYRAPSRVVAGRLELPACAGPGRHPALFDGELTVPGDAVSAALQVVAAVAQTWFGRFSLAPAAVDPLVTVASGRVRLEALSGCGGVHARLDLLTSADGHLSTGTASVEIGPRLRSALPRVAGDLRLSIGRGSITVDDAHQASRSTVTLPSSWLNDLGAAQVLTSAFRPAAGLSRGQAVSFLRMLPRGGDPRTTLWALPSGRSLLLGGRARSRAVCLPGAARLAVLRPFVRYADRLTVYAPMAPFDVPSAAASSWELSAPGLRLTVTLSADPGQGFHRSEFSLSPGGGQQHAMAGLMGWDLAENGWFERPIPFAAPVPA